MALFNRSSPNLDPNDPKVAALRLQAMDLGITDNCIKLYNAQRRASEYHAIIKKIALLTGNEIVTVVGDQYTRGNGDLVVVTSDRDRE